MHYLFTYDFIVMTVMNTVASKENVCRQCRQNGAEVKAECIVVFYVARRDDDTSKACSEGVPKLHCLKF